MEEKIEYHEHLNKPIRQSITLEEFERLLVEHFREFYHGQICDEQKLVILQVVNNLLKKIESLDSFPLPKYTIIQGDSPDEIVLRFDFSESIQLPKILIELGVSESEDQALS